MFKKSIIKYFKVGDKLGISRGVIKWDCYPMLEDWCGQIARSYPMCAEVCCQECDHGAAMRQEVLRTELDG